MTEIILHTCLHSLEDMIKVLPFLFAVFLFIEFAEHKGAGKLGNALTGLGHFGSVGGAVLGCVPQCGFSVMASNLYSGRLISMGTLVAVFLSTSDEAVPILIANPERIDALWKLILCKVIIAVIAGVVVDLCVKAFSKKNSCEEKPCEELCSHCGCGSQSVLKSALKHTVSIALFIFVVSIILNGAIEIIGEEKIKTVLMTDSVFQPFLAAVVGFIPNCASSVILTELYLEGVLSFGAAVAGLCTGAGVGLVVLFKTNRHLKQNLLIVGILYVTAVASGVVIDLIF